MKTLFKNARVLNLKEDNGYILGYVEVTDGIISYVGQNKPTSNYDKIIDVQNNILMPGFVNAHAHTPMTLLRGVKDDYNLQDWLFEGVIPLEEKMTEEDIYWGEMLGIAESVRNGITAFQECYFGYEGICKAINKAKIRARIGMGVKINDPESKNTYVKLLIRS